MSELSRRPSPARGRASNYVETVIIGAGPVGCSRSSSSACSGINAHIIDSLAQVGGQCTELYPDKPIYDIPALPICGAQELIDRLLEQAKPFNATFHLGPGSHRGRTLAGRQVSRRHLHRHALDRGRGGDRRRAWAPFNRGA